ncbi:hypothetical protein NKG05_00680 [Oerskovia sp. M15]
MSLHLSDAAPLTLPEAAPLEEDGPLDSDLHRAVLDLLTGSGGFFLPRVAEISGASQSATLEVLWDLVWAGWVTNDGLGALRSRLGPGGGAHRAPGRRSAPGPWLAGVSPGWAAGRRAPRAARATCAAAPGDGPRCLLASPTLPAARTP